MRSGQPQPGLLVAAAAASSLDAPAFLVPASPLQPPMGGRPSLDRAHTVPDPAHERFKRDGQYGYLWRCNGVSEG